MADNPGNPIPSQPPQDGGGEQCVYGNWQRLLDLLEEVQASRLVLDSIVESLPDPAFVINHERKVIAWNRAMVELTGIAKEEAVGRGNEVYSMGYGQQTPVLIDFLDAPDAQVPRYEHVERRDGALFAETFMPQAYGGRGAYLWIKVSPLRDRQGNTIGAIETVRDISCRKAAERETRAQRDFAERLIQAAQVGVAVLDLQGRVIRVNRFGQELTGYSEGEARGKYLWDLVLPPEQRGEAARRFAEVISHGTPIEHETLIVSHDGRQALIRSHSSVLPAGTGEPAHVLIIGQDVTELRRQQEQLRQAQKMEAIGRLAGGVAHDFNNILTAILGNAQLLRMSLDEGSEKAALAEEIIQASRRAADLTGNLLTFARGGTYRQEPVDLHMLIQEVAALLRRSVDRRIEVDCQLRAPLAVMIGDWSQLENTLLNLGLNARDAMPMGGRLVFATRQAEREELSARGGSRGLPPGPYLELSISDTGVGIDPAIRAHLFEPFFTTKDVGKGTGLGLASVYGCVRSHRGDISVRSEPGKGTTFVILLPLAPAAEVPLPAAAPMVRPVAGRILLVDDERAVRDFAARALRTLGHTVDACADGIEAVNCYRAHAARIDLVILDLVMPHLDGRDTLRRLRQINPAVRVLLSSGFSSEELARRGYQEGVLGFLAKPYRLEQLAEVVARALEGQG